MFKSKLIFDCILCFFYHLIVAVCCYYFTSFSSITRILVGGLFGLLVMFTFQKQRKCVGVRDKVFADYFISDSLFDRFSETFVYTKVSIFLFNLFYMGYFITVVSWLDIFPVVSNFLKSLWTDSIVEAEEITKQSRESIKSSVGNLSTFYGVFKKHALNPYHLAGVGAMCGGFLYKYKNPECISQVIRCFKSEGAHAFGNPIVFEIAFGMSKTVTQGLFFLPGSAYFVSDMYQSGVTQATKNYFLPDARDILNNTEGEEINKC